MKVLEINVYNFQVIYSRYAVDQTYNVYLSEIAPCCIHQSNVCFYYPANATI